MKSLPFTGPVGFLGVATGDGRTIRRDADVELLAPVPVFAQRDGAVNVGTAECRLVDGVLVAEGVANLAPGRYGVGIDVDRMVCEDPEAELLTGEMVVIACRLRALTLSDNPAWPDARIIVAEAAE